MYIGVGSCSITTFLMLLNLFHISSNKCKSNNHSTILPNGSLTFLPRNIRLSKETKLDTVLSKVTSTSPPPCDSCDENSPIAYCTECDQLLCNVCWDAHQKLLWV